MYGKIYQLFMFFIELDTCSFAVYSNYYLEETNGIITGLGLYYIIFIVHHI